MIPLVSRVTDDELGQVAERMRAAARTASFDGRETPANTLYRERCTRIHRATGTILLFTRDVGHHTSGWFKNPDFERCQHLSLSFRESSTGIPMARDLRLSERWVRAFFPDDSGRWLWGEPPVTERAKQLEVWHYRLFCDEHWQPIKPRGEVYSTEFTEQGWKSASELFETERRIIESPLYPG